MKPALAVVAIAFSICSLQADEKWNVRTELLVVRVEQHHGLRLRSALREPRTVEAAVREIYEMIARGDATLIGAPILWNASGRRHFDDGPFPRRPASETTEEFRCATEFEPPQPGQQWKPGKRVKSEDEMFKERLYQFMIVPTTFETRNLGLTLEVDPKVLADGHTISLEIAPRHVTFEGFHRVLHSGPLNGTWREGQPTFRSLSISTATTVISGKWQLLSVNVLRDRAPEMEFFLVRVTAIPVLP